MLHILYGKDTFSIGEALEELKVGLGPRETLEPNTTRLDGRAVSLDVLMAACLATPFLAEARLVIVDGLLGHLAAALDGEKGRGRGGKATAGQWEKLPELVQEMPPTTSLVLVDGEIQKGRNPFLAILAPYATVRPFPGKRPRELPQWVQERVRRQGGQITAGAIKLLAELVGSDLWTMHSELQKLLVYSGEAPVDERAVRLLVGRAREANIFALADALLESRRQEAVQLMASCLEDGEDPGQMVGFLAGRLRLLAQARAMLEQGAKDEDVMARWPNMADFAARRLLEQARRLGSDRLVFLYQRLLEADLSVKTGRLTGEMALELLAVG